MNLEAVLKSISGGKPALVYLFYGPEAYQVQKGSQAVAQAVLGEGLPDFNFDRFYGRDCDAAQMIAVAQGLPMMADRRVVFCSGVDGLKPKGLDLLGQYLEDPSPSTTLVLTAVKIDLRKKVYKSIKKVGQLIDCQKVYANHLPGWIRRMFQEYNRKVDAGAVDALVRLVGSDLFRLESEVGKVVLFADEAPVIMAEHVHGVVANIRQESIFDLTDAVANRDPDRALIILKRITESGERALGILGMIWRHIRILVLAKDALKRGRGLSEALNTLGVRDFLHDRYRRQLEGFTTVMLNRAYLAIRDTDFALKSSRLPERTVLEKLILDLCA